MFIPDPNFFHPGSKFVQLASRIRIKEFKYFTPKNCFYASGNMIRVVQPGSGSRGQKGTGSATLILRITWLSQHLKIGEIQSLYLPVRIRTGCQLVT
jgi:hypothetical protein